MPEAGRFEELAHSPRGDLMVLKSHRELRAGLAVFLDGGVYVDFVQLGISEVERMLVRGIEALLSAHLLQRLDLIACIPYFMTARGFENYQLAPLQNPR